MPKFPEESRFCSILIPAYEYPDGIRRILDGLINIDPTAFEIVISDDSSTDAIKTIVKSHQLTSKGVVRYHKNPISLGAVSNWNHLISCAKSDVLILLHHDEYHIDAHALNRAVNDFYCSQSDVAVGRIKLVKNFGGLSVTHFPLFLSKLLILKFAEYIYVRNFIGPVSCLIFRKKLKVFFDINLQWYVDTDFYYRLRRQTKKWSFFNYLVVYSVINRASSITAQIKNDLSNIVISERKYLIKNRHLNFFSCYLLNPYLKFFELVVWFIFRLFWNSIRFFAAFCLLLAHKIRVKKYSENDV